MPVNFEQLIGVFELSHDFTRDELDQAYRDLVQVWHPDKYANNARLQLKAEEKLKEINGAYATLKEFLANDAGLRERARRTTASGNVGAHRVRADLVEPHSTTVHPPPGAGPIDDPATLAMTLSSVFHPTDFSPASAVAFAHALKIAVMARALLSILHVAPSKEDVDFAEFPEVRQTLERWGTLPAGSSKEDLSTVAGIFVEKVVAVDDDPASSIRHFLARHPRDLIVLATHQYREPVRWIKKSVAEPVARESDGMTLFIPEGVDGFISHCDGRVQLRRILIPVDHRPAPQLAVDAAVALVQMLGCADGVFTLAHVGSPSEMPAVATPTPAGWMWQRVARPGEVVREILELERERSADLIVMTTQGRDGFLDALRGSTTERVLRGSRCPLLAIPALRGDVIGV
jgi:nucleotide-binding universal stress UspA family protein